VRNSLAGSFKDRCSTMGATDRECSVDGVCRVECRDVFGVEAVAEDDTDDVVVAAMLCIAVVNGAGWEYVRDISPTIRRMRRLRWRGGVYWRYYWQMLSLLLLTRWRWNHSTDCCCCRRRRHCHGDHYRYSRLSDIITSFFAFIRCFVFHSYGTGVSVVSASS
jgi:hypothetical protein